LKQKNKPKNQELIMREKRTIQGSIFEHYAEHEIGHELRAMSDWLNQSIDLLDWVVAEVKQRNVSGTVQSLQALDTACD
jgi:NADPH-dependent curcumin reductase CurA